MAAKVRLAVEGCGHGTLNSIYSSLEEKCRDRGWESVDLLIICGDFQACRNQFDLNVTAMPAKYRRMADFHEYYSGTRRAPCLTVFVGGNHEASNYLYELYYGGWVAPNIYYMGAANILRFGPLRIAGLSGIYKGYDYHKPHFERLPYNESDYYGIYHVRELDVRKILNVRTQVDIGISHDWPQGVEWSGDHTKLFNKKGHLRADAEAQRLGSPAARYCLDRLRPAHWYSAHLHVKYSALIRHGPHDSPQNQVELGDGHLQSLSNIAHRPNANSNTSRDFSVADNPALSAWNAFPEVASKEAAEEADRAKKRQQEDREKDDRTGVKSLPSYTYNETWKRVQTDENLSRELSSVQRKEVRSEDIPNIPQVDGAAFSAITPFKRRQRTLSQDAEDSSVTKAPKTSSESHPSSQSTQIVGNAAPENGRPEGGDNVTGSKNQDEIDIVLSGSDENPSSPEAAKVAEETDDKSGKEQTPIKSPSKDEISTYDSTEGDENQRPFGPSPSIENRDVNDDGVDNNGEVTLEAKSDGTTQYSAVVSDDLRSQLASISKSFAPTRPSEAAKSLPFPENITNTTTNFLALDKYDTHRQYLELEEILAVSEQEGYATEPFQLKYDKEWLAITRAFANELELGGSPRDHCPANLGEVVYGDRVKAEESWVEENIVHKGLLTIPENFVGTAPPYNAEEEISPHSMPREFPNPQTDAFCRLIGIENKFAISDVDIEQRIAQGPRPESSTPRYNKRGGRGQGNRTGRGGFRGGGGHRGGRGGRRGGRGRF